LGEIARRLILPELCSWDLHYREVTQYVWPFSYAVPEADAITGGGMVDQSGRGWDFRQVETKVHGKSRKHGGQSGNVASERPVIFCEIPVLVEPETNLRRVTVDGAFGWNVRYGIVQVYEPERILARVR
jgi:hypothetical protein